jgi:hypothetical protein
MRVSVEGVTFRLSASMPAEAPSFSRTRKSIRNRHRVRGRLAFEAARVGATIVCARRRNASSR